MTVTIRIVHTCRICKRRNFHTADLESTNKRQISILGIGI